MSFWNLSDGKTVEAQKDFDANPALEPMPDGTCAISALDSIKWEIKEFEGVSDELIEARWVVLDGEFKGRKVYHKIRILDGDTKKADKAKKMLAAIDANAGGELFANVTSRPTDEQLAMYLLGKPMITRYSVWSMAEKTGNWVSAVAPSNGAVTAPAHMSPATHVEPSAASGAMDEDIPFAPVMF